MTIQAVVGLAVGGALLLFHFHKAGALALCVSSTLIVIAGVAPVSWLHAIRRGLDLFASGVRTVVSAAVLTIVYGCFFVPVGLLTRGRPKARFQAKLDREAKSYWTRHADSSPERQF